MDYMLDPGAASNDGERRWATMRVRRVTPYPVWTDLTAAADHDRSAIPGSTTRRLPNGR